MGSKREIGNQRIKLRDKFEIKESERWFVYIKKPRQIMNLILATMGANGGLQIGDLLES